MRQLISRIEDGLHARLKARAKVEHRSMNSLVRDLLTEGLADGAEPARKRFRERVRAAGLLYEPPPPKNVPSHEEALRIGRAFGTSVSEALAEERSRR